MNTLGKSEDFNPYLPDDNEKSIEKLLAIVDKKEDHNLGNKAINAERPITSISQSSLFTGATRIDLSVVVITLYHEVFQMFLLYQIKILFSGSKRIA